MVFILAISEKSERVESTNFWGELAKSAQKSRIDLTFDGALFVYLLMPFLLQDPAQCN